MLEKNDAVGGLAMQEEFHPGYKATGILQDTGCVRMNLIKKLDLHTHGLRTSGRRSPVSILSENGTSITLSDDVEMSEKSIEQISAHDAQAYRVYRELIDKVSPWIRSLLDEPQPDLVALSSREMVKMLGKGLGLRMLGKKTMQELLKVLPMCVADFLNEYFETDFLKAGMAGPALQASFNGPWSAFTMILLAKSSTNKFKPQ